MSQQLRIGIIGTGGMANHQAEQFHKIAGVTLAACYDIDSERAHEFAAKHGIALAAATLDDLWSSVDAVSIVTPDRFHAGPTIQSLQAGKHVLCEKPLTVTLEEARQVAAEASRATARGLVHMINFSYRRSAAFQEAMRLVKSGALGELRHVQSSYLQSWLVSHAWGDWSQSDGWLWRLCTADGSGGVLGDLGCHLLDLTTGVSGDLAEVRCSLHTFPKVADGELVTEWRGKSLDANDTAIMELRLANGGVGVAQTTRWATGHINHLRVEVHGTEGALMFDLDRDYDALDTCLGEARHAASWTTTKLPPTPDNYERFVQSIRTGNPDQPDLLRGAQVQSYLDACLRSAQSGQWEAVKAFLQ